MKFQTRNKINLKNYTHWWSLCDQTKPVGEKNQVNMTLTLLCAAHSECSFKKKLIIEKKNLKIIDWKKKSIGRYISN